MEQRLERLQSGQAHHTNGAAAHDSGRTYETVSATLVALLDAS